MASVASAFDQSVERAILDRGMEDRLESHDHFMGPLVDESEEEGFPSEPGWEPPARSPLLDYELDADLESPREVDEEASLSFWRAAAIEEPT
mmetsp:Transcript_38046/g.56784  ORF Transcript_38046/g.56784 Transcript_38046/m.56784 type:complete len:92 (+) Transcript_38046:2-277(+)